MSDWWAFLDWYENLIVYPLAIGALLLLLKVQSLRGRVASGALLVLLFLPHIQKVVGGYYFDYLCRTQAGEFIYRTVDNVEGVLQMRPRDGSKDYFDRMKAGDIPEDPWGHTNREARWPWSMLGPYQYIETLASGTPLPSDVWRKSLHESMFMLPNAGEGFARFSGYDGRSLSTFRKQFVVQPSSKFGFDWREIPGVLHWAFNVHQGEILVKELRSNQVLALMRGFYRTRPSAICPAGKDDEFVQRFVQRVLRPIGAGGEGKVQ